MKYLAGTWEWEIDGQKGTITWQMDGSAPVLVGHGKGGGATWISAMCWHEGDKVIIDRVINSEGGQSENRYEVQNADQMSGVSTGWEPQGKTSSKITLTRTDEDSWTYHRTDHMVGGERMPDLKVIVTRVKNPKVLAAPAAEKVDNGN